MSKKNIAIIVGDLGIGGAEKQLIYFLKSLKKNSHNIKVFCLCDVGPALDHIISSNIDYIIINHKFRLLKVLKLSLSIKKFRPDLIQCWHFFVSIFLFPFIFSKIKIVGSVRGDGILELKKYNPILKKFFLLIPKYYLFNSFNAKSNFHNYTKFSVKKMFVLDNCIEIDKNSNNNKIKKKYSIVLISNLLKLKRVDLFIKILINIKEKYPRIKTLVIGEGPERKKIESLINAHKLEKNIKLTGFVNNVSKYIVESKVGVLLSESEGSPNAIFEYMLAGIPFVSSNVGDVSRFTFNNQVGYVINEHNLINNFSKKLLYLLSNQKLRNDLGKKSKRLINEFSFKRYNKSVNRYLNKF